MKDLDELLDQLRQEGHIDSEGVFTSSSEGALDRLSERLLPDPQMYLLKCIQALVAGHGSPIVIRQKIAWVEIEAPVGLAPPDLNPLDWVSQAWRSEIPAIRHLATALVGGWRLFDEIHVHWGPLRWKLVPGEGTTPQELTSYCPPGHARIDFKRKHWKLLSDKPPHFDRVFACPVPLHSPWTSGMWQVRCYSGIDHFPRPGCELMGALATGATMDDAAPLMVPDTVRGYPVFFSPSKPLQALLTTSQKGDGMDAAWYRAERFYLLTDQDDRSAILPVDSGVGLDPIPVELGIHGLYCVVSVQREGLHTDLSQFRLRQDESFQRLVAELRGEVQALLNQVVEQLEGWKPNTTLQSNGVPAVTGFIAGGVLGFGLIMFTGMMFPFHFLALPGGMLGAYYGSRRWRKKALKLLRKRAESMEPPPT